MDDDFIIGIHTDVQRAEGQIHEMVLLRFLRLPSSCLMVYRTEYGRIGVYGILKTSNFKEHAGFDKTSYL